MSFLRFDATVFFVARTSALTPRTVRNKRRTKPIRVRVLIAAATFILHVYVRRRYTAIFSRLPVVVIIVFCGTMRVNSVSKSTQLYDRTCSL
jgi:hypothetical protein